MYLLYSMILTHARLKRADTSKLREIFLQFATETDRNGEKVITNENFIRKFLGLYEHDNYNRESLDLIASIVDLDKDGYISFDEFETFEKLLCSPDALYRTAFSLFRSSNKNDYVTYDDFVNLMKKCVIHQKLPFDLDSDFTKLYFGEDKTRVLAFEDFSQFLHDFHEEYGLIAFRKYNRDGFIDIADFKDIMLTVKSHLVNDTVKKNIINSPSFPEGKNRIGFSYYMAFNNLLNNMELFKRVYLYATGGDKKTPVNKNEFLHSAQMISQITPLQVDILFAICKKIHDDDTILYSYLREITPEHYYRRVKQSIAEIKAVSSPDERSVFIQILENVYRFFIGAMAGCLGAAAVYPIDFVKTRIQSQRIGPKGEQLYANYLDCFKKIVQNEGARSLYKGMGMQLIGVAPEKAIKLSVNDFMRDKMSDKDGNITFFGEYISGFVAGCSQVIFTNPLEIVKIRLQMAGESAKGNSMTAFKVIKDLGFLGLYRGCIPCMMRDSVFSSIYFPTYARLKALLADENGYNNPITLLLSGAISGMPAASLVTPFDVIKTRIQVIPKKGQTEYHGVVDAAKKIYREEGFKAFWKGTLARVCRSSPQFGVTLASYEILQRLFYIDFGGSRPAGSELRVSTPLQETTRKPHHIGGYQVAIPVLTGLETKFGISLPRFSFPEQ